MKKKERVLFFSDHIPIVEGQLEIKEIPYEKVGYHANIRKDFVVASCFAGGTLPDVSKGLKQRIIRGRKIQKRTEFCTYVEKVKPRHAMVSFDSRWFLVSFLAAKEEVLVPAPSPLRKKAEKALAYA